MQSLKLAIFLKFHEVYQWFHIEDSQPEGLIPQWIPQCIIQGEGKLLEVHARGRWITAFRCALPRWMDIFTNQLEKLEAAKAA